MTDKLSEKDIEKLKAIRDKLINDNKIIKK